jgi:DNA-binding NarL/FixJ family response regulator
MTKFSSCLSSLAFGRTRAGGSFLFQESQSEQPWSCWLLVLLRCQEDQQRVQRWKHGPIGHLPHPFQIDDLVTRLRHLDQLSEERLDLDKIPSLNTLNPLTAREKEVLEAITEGCTNAEIAQSLNLSVETVKSHVKMLLQKLQARDRTQAAVLALTTGLIQLPPSPEGTLPPGRRGPERD